MSEKEQRNVQLEEEAKLYVFFKELGWRLNPMSNNYLGQHSALVLALLSHSGLIDLREEDLIPRDIKFKEETLVYFEKSVLLDVGEDAYYQIKVKTNPEDLDSAATAALDINLLHERSEVKRLMTAIPRSKPAAASLILDAILDYYQHQSNELKRFITWRDRELASSSAQLCIDEFNTALHKKTTKEHAKR